MKRIQWDKQDNNRKEHERVKGRGTPHPSEASQCLTCSSSLSKGLMLTGNLSPNYVQGLERHAKRSTVVVLKQTFPEEDTFQPRLD